MNSLKQTSLGNQVSKKISAWVLIFVIAIIIMIFFVSLAQSLQMFNKQVSSWISIAPQQAITNLIDSDEFSIKREVELIKSTGLFSVFGITDNQKRVIASFGASDNAKLKYIPITDDANLTWGYYFFQRDILEFFSPFLYSGAIFLVLILVLYGLVRGRMRTSLEAEFAQFNQFINEIETVTNQIHQVYIEELEIFIHPESSYTNEQTIINRAISKLIEEIKQANKSLREAISASEQKRFEDELTRTALQVAHDIGSPLATLEAIVQSASFLLPEDNRVTIRNAATKIRDIANSLLKKAKHDLLSMDNGEISQQMLASLIQQVVTEKRLQYQSTNQINIQFDFNQSSYGLFAMIRVAEFSRILSNIINNSVESIVCEKGVISISLCSDDQYAVIRITDNGKGMSADLISKLGKLGVTYGKSNGHGLGLFHAKNTIEIWGGHLEIQSNPGQGTTINIYLPKAKPPEWFMPELKIIDGQTVVIIDDDEDIHAIWNERLKDLNVSLLHFYSPEEVINWKNNENASIDSMFYVCDHEFIGSNMNGIDLINELKINFSSILVTNRFYTEEVMMRCEASRIKLLPKDMANIVPINMEQG